MRFLLAFLLLCSSSGFAYSQTFLYSSGQPAVGTTAKVAGVTVSTSGGGLTIPSNFLGLSGENIDFTNGFYQGSSGTWTSVASTGNAASYIALANLLGSHGVFRIGGGSADNSTAPNITSGMASNLNAFIGALGANWTLVYDLDLVANDSATATTTASNIATAVGVGNVTFQFGNEPSLAGFTASTYETRWNAYYAAVTASVPSAKFAATNDLMHNGWGATPTVVAALTPGIAGMQFISQQWYSFCDGTWTSIVPAILINSIFQNEQGPGGVFGAANTNAGYLLNNNAFGSTGQRMIETNTICLHGTPGMSDRMMASTWFLDLALVLANNGWQGMNLHASWGQDLNGSFVAHYNPFVLQADNNFSAGAVFYGMYLFSKIEGQQILPSSVAGNANINAIATLRTSGKSNIIIVNNDVSQSVTVTPAQSAAWSTANVLQIKSANGAGCSDAGLTIGGQPIGESGSWSGATFSINNGQSISLGPCEAALVSVQ